MATPNRWAPWIEAYIPLASNQTINSTTPANLTGVSVTVTPHVNSRAAVPVAINALNGASGGYTLIVGLLVNGVLLTPRLNLLLAANLQDQATLMQSVDMVAGTSYTFGVQAYINVSGGSYTIVQSQSGLGPIIVMPNLTQ